VPTILVVDDEPMIRNLIETVLEQEGFDVLCAENGPDAIHMSERHPGQIDLLVSDVTMPGMDGFTLAEELHAADPNLPVLFVSGYSERIPLDKGKPFPLLQKPFPVPALVGAVRSTVRRRV
jgi:two-component system, cell cycle sensor histidine kinase and response regulator CckA